MTDTMTNSLVSVILPVYQGEHIVLKAIESVLAQTHPIFELIIVDDGSTDGTASILQQLNDPRIRVIHQVNQGVAVARNTGIAHAKGIYFAFIDADDCWLPQKLAIELNTLAQASTEIAIVYSGYYAVDEEGKLIHLSPLYQLNGMIPDDVITEEGLFLPSTTLIHKQIVETVGGFDPNCYHEDRAFFIRACQNYPVIPTGERLVIYRQSTQGRCRRILSQFSTAYNAEMSVVTSVASVLTEAQQSLLWQIQTRNLFYRFLMYGFVESARQLFPYIPKDLLINKKGVLALLTMLTGINALYGCRRTVQAIIKLCYSFRWQHNDFFPKSEVKIAC